MSETINESVSEEGLWLRWASKNSWCYVCHSNSSSGGPNLWSNYGHQCARVRNRPIHQNTWALSALSMDPTQHTLRPFCYWSVHQNSSQCENFSTILILNIRTLAVPFAQFIQHTDDALMMASVQKDDFKLVFTLTRQWLGFAKPASHSGSDF